MSHAVEVYATRKVQSVFSFDIILQNAKYVQFQILIKDLPKFICDPCNFSGEKTYLYYIRGYYAHL